MGNAASSSRSGMTFMGDLYSQEIGPRSLMLADII
jgi:hypothetical protein